MQNLDFYSGKNVREFAPHFNSEDPEYFAKISNIHSKDEHRRYKKASRILSLLFALCILSFTAGLIIGLKFASGSNKELVDPHTKEAVSDIGQKVTSLINNKKDDAADVIKDKNLLFSKDDFPYVIRFGDKYNKSQSQEIAGIISHHGHTVILANDSGKYKIFIGPYRSHEEALNSLGLIKSYSLKGKVTILKR